MTGVLDPLVDLAVELRGDIPRTVVQTLICEALDQCADLILCRGWAEDRQRLYPAALRCAHSRHVGQSYERRRAAECAT